MRVVFKYPLKNLSKNTLEIPKYAKYLRVAMQNGNPFLWAEIDTDMPKVLRVFQVCATGQPIPDGFLHVGSFEDGMFIWHLYEEV